jgi:hypothetical protein
MLQDDKVEGVDGPEGCYLVFDAALGGRLVLLYSNSRIPKNAVGFWYVPSVKAEKVEERGTIGCRWIRFDDSYGPHTHSLAC